MPKRSAITFTDVFVRSAKPAGQRKSYFDGLTPGLELRVSKSGAKIWAFRYRDKYGKTVRLRLGDTRSTSLKRARELALTARAEVAVGGDPHKERQAKIADARAQVVRTVEDLADAFMADARTRLRAASIKSDEQRLRAHIVPKLGRFEVERLTRSQVRELVHEIGGRGHKVAANRVGALVGRMYRFARRRLDMRVENPAEGLQTVFAEASRTRVLTDIELRSLWQALARPNAPLTPLGAAPTVPPLSETSALCLQIAALTLQRIGEVARMREAEIDVKAKLWVVPATRTKNRREHLVPLSPEALALIRKAIALSHKATGGKPGSDCPVFPSPKGEKQSIDRHAVSRAMNRLCTVLGIEDATPHDLRRTGASAITSERIGLPRFYVSAVLNHISETGGVTAIYDRNEYLSEKRRSLDAWGSLLAQVTSNRARPRRR